MFFTKNTKYNIFSRLILGVIWVKTSFFHFETVISQCTEALLNWEIFFEDEDTKGVWGENIVDFHF